MKTRLMTVVALMLTARTLPAQDRPRLYTEPVLPQREALERLNLEVAWRADVPVDGRRDGFLSVQHTGRQILTQTRAGVVSLFDAETGRLVWRVRVGDPFRVSMPPTFNSLSIFATNGTNFYAFDRSNGAAQWQLSLPDGLAAPPVADEDQIYLFAGSGTVYAYHPATVEVVENFAPYALPPTYGQPDLSVGKKEERVVQVTRPLPVWDLKTLLRLDLPAVQSHDSVLIPDRSGVLRGLLKYPKEFYSADSYRFPLDVGLSAGPGVHGQTAYQPALDGYVYAFDITKARIVWRQLLGAAPLTRTPAVTDQDLYVVSEREGMARLDRVSGEPLWKVPNGNRVTPVQPAADRFVASSPKYVYAFDRSGRLLVLDRARGLLLSRLDLRDYVVPVVNEYTDRIYLAANNGQIVCLRDRDYAEPREMRKISQREAEAGKTPLERAKDLRDLLSKPVQFEDGEKQPLGKFLDDIRRMYGVKSFVSEKTYKDNNQRSPLELEVRVKKRDKPAPLGDLIQDVLGAMNPPSRFSQVGEMIFILPKAAPMGPRP